MSIFSTCSTTSMPSRGRSAAVLITGALIGGLSFSGAAADAATLPASDISNGGRLSASASNFQLPEGSSLGSVGGSELTQVSELDPERYAGKWYQVAAVPQPFTAQCISNTTANYGVTDEANVSVKNSCKTLFGNESSISGNARIQDPAQPASLHVSFDGIPGQSPNGPVNYRVTYLEDDYSLAIVGDPQRFSGFVLSRTPALTGAQWNNVKEITGKRGWWNCAFLTTPQDSGRKDIVPLCTV